MIQSICSLSKKMVSSNALEITCHINGEINANTLKSLKDRLAEAIKDNPSHILIDLRKATLINGQGIIEIHSALIAIQNLGGSLSLINAGQPNESLTFESHALSNGVVLVTLSGKLDLASTASAEQKLLNLCRGDKQRLLIDLSGMDFISSVGIRMFLQAIKLTSIASGKVLFLNPSPFAKSALEMAGFSQLIAVGTPEEIASVI